MDLPGIIRTLQQKQNNRAAEPVSAQHLSISTLDEPITPPTNCKIGFIQGQKLANQAKMSLEHVVRFLIQNIILFCLRFITNTNIRWPSILLKFPTFTS